jgi:hypothetical protein
MANNLVATRCDLFDGHICILIIFSKYFAMVNNLVAIILLIFQDLLLQ